MHDSVRKERKMVRILGVGVREEVERGVEKGVLGKVGEGFMEKTESLLLLLAQNRCHYFRRQGYHRHR